MVIKLHFIDGYLYYSNKLVYPLAILQLFNIWFGFLVFSSFVLYMQWLGTHCGKIYRGLVKSDQQRYGHILYV